MNKAYFFVLAAAVVSVFADFLLKLASEREASFRSYHVYLAVALYGATAIGWLIAMKTMTLASIGVVYSILMVLLLTVLGVTVFRETLTLRETAGLCCALAALVLMQRG